MADPNSQKYQQERLKASRIVKSISYVFFVITFLLFIISAFVCNHYEGGVSGWNEPDSGCFPLVFSTVGFVVWAFILYFCVAPSLKEVQQPYRD